VIVPLAPAGHWGTTYEAPPPHCQPSPTQWEHCHAVCGNETPQAAASPSSPASPTWLPARLASPATRSETFAPHPASSVATRRRTALIASTYHRTLKTDNDALKIEVTSLRERTAKLEGREARVTKVEDRLDALETGRTP
jgi:hypothetical protein